MKGLDVMKKLLGTSIIAILCIVLVVTPNASFAENQALSIPFLGKRVLINFESRQTQDGEGVNSYLAGAPGGEKIHVDCYEPEGGAAPQIKSVFVNGKKSKKLFVIVAWNVDVSAINTGGNIYQVFVYDESVQCAGKDCVLHSDAELAKRFGVGFDGVREGEPLTYKYKTAAAVKRKLTEWGYR
jgi:hypothetical protein